MMRILASFMGLLLALVSAGATQAQRVTFDVEPFDRISVAGQLDVVVVQDPQHSLFAEGRQEVLDALEVDYNGNRLRVTLPRNSLFSSDPDWRASVVIGTPLLEGIEASRGTELVGRTLKVGDRLRIEASTGAFVQLSGACQDLKVESTTGAVVEVEELTCLTADLETTTGSVIKAYASQEASAEASLGGVISLKGNPEQLRQSSSLGGVVTVD